LIGCAAVSLNRRVTEFQRPFEGVRFFELLDWAVVETGVRDASVFTVSGFPYLRTNRFLTVSKGELNTDARKAQWLRRMQQLDLEARQKEIRNLPADALKDLTHILGEPSGPQTLQEKSIYYSDKLLAHDQRQPNFYEVLTASVTDPDEYSAVMRIVGFYPLTSIPVTAATCNVQEKFRNWHSDPVDQLYTLGELAAYVPSQRTEYAAQIARLVLNRSRQNPLLIPLIFFPMGIVDIGSMRQRGHHAVKLAGREHFDDPDLVDGNFKIKKTFFILNNIWLLAY
jgi:hypothetical protein